MPGRTSARQRGLWRGIRPDIWLGLFPLLVLGFSAGALADRLAFLGWALGAGALYVWTLHGTLAWEPGRRRAVLALALALALAAFAVVVRRHAEPLDIGLSAFAPPLARLPLATAGTWNVTAALLALAGAGGLVAAERNAASGPPPTHPKESA